MLLSTGCCPTVQLTTLVTCLWSTIFTRKNLYGHPLQVELTRSSLVRNLILQIGGIPSLLTLIVLPRFVIGVNSRESSEQRNHKPKNMSSRKRKKHRELM